MSIKAQWLSANHPPADSRGGMEMLMDSDTEDAQVHIFFRREKQKQTFGNSRR